ncbi:MAG: hypothetical protein SPI59_03215 [Finegoldia sp.]|nr:hypothetical protein [Finegoldia sp.]
MDKLRGIDYLRQKLNIYKLSVKQKQDAYDMKNIQIDPSITIPPRYKNLYKGVLGWNRLAVNRFADRIVFAGFDNDTFEFEDIFASNNADIFFDSAILSAATTSCCFVSIAKVKDRDIPRLDIIQGSNATGVIDSSNGLLKEGYAVLKHDDMGMPEIEAYYVPYKTYIYYQGRKNPEIIDHPSRYPLLVPIINRPDASRPFGRSRITKACMYYQKLAKRTLERMEITSEFYSWPQKYILGMESTAESFDDWKATVTSMLRIDKDSDGDKPSLGQFQAASMSPFTEQLRNAAALFSGETGLTLDDLGFLSDNPSSVEAIQASHENLRLEARKAQRTFGSGFLNVGYLAACLRDGIDYDRYAFYKVRPEFEPIFEPNGNTLSAIGDGMIKINQAVPNYFDEKSIYRITGFKGSDNVNR